VASEAIAQTDDADAGHRARRPGGEGCSIAGGCATCPYMKMNSLDALFDLLQRIDREPQSNLLAFEPRKYTRQIRGRSAAELGGEPILHMRAFQKTGELPEALVHDIVGRLPQTGS
jgi:quinolinate synthase